MGQAALPIGMGVLGGLGGLGSANQANRPRTSRFSETSTQQLNPYGGTGRLDELLDLNRGGLAYAFANAPFGPSQMQVGLTQRLRDSILPRGGIGGGGGGGRSLSGGGGGGGGAGGGGGGAPGGGVGGIQSVGMSPQAIAQFFPTLSPYMQQVLEGGFLGQNPYLDDVTGAITDDTMRALQEQVLPEIEGRFARAGRTGPSSQAYAGALGDAREGALRGLTGQIAQLRAGSYESERDRMMQAMGLYSGETQGARGNLTGMRNQDLQSATAIQQAQIAAAVQRAAIAAQARAAARSNSIAQQQLGLQSQGQRFSQMLQALGAAGGLNQSRLSGATLPMNLIGQYGGQISPLLAQFGEQTGSRSGTNTQPGAGLSPIGSFLQGGLGGALAGLGAGGGGVGATLPNSPLQYPAYGPGGMGALNPGGGGKF